MIGRDEILRVANTLGLEPRVVEKDYVLGWLLHAIARDPLFGERWVFKGGPCLKKCFFETYRFSEDLDFTVTEPSQLNEDFLLERFRAIGTQLYDETGIEIPAELLRFKVWSGKFGRPAGEGRVSYRGPIAPRGGEQRRQNGAIALVLDPVLGRSRQEVARLVVADRRRLAFAALGPRPLHAFDRIVGDGVLVAEILEQ
jgi:hypothetical protein